MPSSYEKINYSLRPSKGIERKMLAEALARLSPFDKMKNYRYIGFGSTYFSDFILLHKKLGITKMISMEKESENSTRFDFNKPYSCIKMLFGLSGEILPVLDWKDKTILWLDYDGQLDASILSDIGIFCSKAVSGSLLMVTVNAHPDKIGNQIQDVASERLRLLQDAVGHAKVPEDLHGRDLRKWGKAAACRRIIINEILEILNSRNGGMKKAERLVFKQLFNFNYQDNAMMMTIGGVLFKNQDIDLYKKCYFKDLSFIRTKEEPYLIEVPCLTHREIRCLDGQLPRQKHKQLRLPAVKYEDIKKYEKIYRYFPTFTEAEI